MNIVLLYAISGIIIFSIGLYGLVSYTHFIRKSLAINVMSTGIFIFLIVIANRKGHGIPDPVPHALVLTGIVVAVCATALMLAIALRTELISFQKNSEDKRKE